MGDRNHLRLRMRHDVMEGRAGNRLEVLDADGTVLGDLAHSAAAVRWDLGVQNASTLSILTLEIAVERCAIDSIEVPGHNGPARDPQPITPKPASYQS